MFNDTVSRRHLLAASAAALASTAAVTAPAALAHAATPSPDAELLATIEEWSVVHSRLAHLYDGQDDAEGRYLAARPNFPGACNRQPGDPALNLCASFHVGKSYNRS
jgi:hypothetical protein